MNKCKPPKHAQKVSKHVSTQRAFSKNSTSLTGTTGQASAATRRGGAAMFLNHRWACALVYLSGLIDSCHTTSTPAEEHTKKYSHGLGEKEQRPEGHDSHHQMSFT